MILESLAHILEQKSIGVRGQSIFVGAMPDTVEAGVRIWSMPGSAHVDMPSTRRPDVQFVCRGAGYPEANALIEQVFDAMVLDRTVIDGVVIFSSRPIGQPFSFGREEGKFWHQAVNFSVVWRKE